MKLMMYAEWDHEITQLVKDFLEYDDNGVSEKH